MKVQQGEGSEQFDWRMQRCPELAGQMLDWFFRSGHDGIIGLDLQGTIVLWSPGAQSLLGWCAEEILGQPVHRLATLAQHREVDLLLRRVCDNTEMPPRETQALHKEGHRVDLSRSITPIRNPQQQPVGAVVVTRDITRLKQAERIATEHQQQLRRLAARQQDQLEKQLKVIAVQLQEEFGQQLAAMRLELARLEGRLAVAAPEADIETQSLHAMLSSTISGLRQLSQQMRPSILDELGLCSAVDQLREMTSSRHGLISDFHCQCAQGRVSPQAALTIFRIIQEAVANIVQHARASRFSVQLSHAGDQVLVTVKDDGQGLQDPVLRDAVGLLTMGERALVWGGTVEVRNGAQGGVVMEARFPSQRVLLN